MDINVEQANLNKTLISLSLGALTLSIGFINKIAPQKFYFWLVIIAWCCLSLTIITIIISYYIRIRKNTNHQKRFEEFDRMKRGFTGIYFPEDSPDSNLPVKHSLGTLLSVLFFIVGFASLVIFVVLNWIE